MISRKGTSGSTNRAKRCWAIASAVGCVFFASGCSLCCPPYLDDFATVGGKWQRSNPTDGRVGSAFSDAGATLGGATTIVGSDHGIDSGYSESPTVPHEFQGEIIFPETVHEQGVITLDNG